jgi:hypothetical protein
MINVYKYMVLHSHMCLQDLVGNIYQHTNGYKYNKKLT